MAEQGRPSKWNIKPVHQSFQTLITDSASSHYPTNILNNTHSLKSFQTFTSFATGSSHLGSSQRSGYQYLTALFFTLTKTVDTPVDVVDDHTLFLVKYIDEPFTLTDFNFTGTSYQTEAVSITDEVLVTIRPVFDELININEALFKAITTEEPVAILDEYQCNWITYIQELASNTDTAQSAQIDQLQYSLTVTSKEAVPPYQTFVVQNQVYMTDIESMRVGVITSALTPVVSISALPSGSSVTPVINVSGYNLTTTVNPITMVSANAFHPTVIIGGTTYATDPSTAPAGTYSITANTFFVQYLNPSIGGVDACQLLNFDLQFDYLGGTFSFATVNDPGFTLGQEINLFGFLGTVTESGKIYSNSQIGTVTKGIFGSRNMNKQLNILGAGSPTMFSLLTNSLLSTKAQNTLGTYEGAAAAIATLGGGSLHWVLPGGDVPLIDFTVQEGETALSALSSIAAQFGGVLLWDGGNAYTIAAPTFTRGYWEVPNQSLITSSGIQYLNKLDLSTGAFGTGFFSVPIETYFNAGTYDTPNTTNSTSTPIPKVQKVASTTKVYTNSDPLWIVDCPLDTEEIWVQILVPGSSFVAAQYVTADPEQWYSLGSPSIAGPYAKLTLKGGALGAVVPQAIVSYALFPTTVDAVNNGNFVMSVGVTRKSQSSIFQSAVDTRKQQTQNMLARLLGSFRYVPTYTGTINSFFFGSIPLPGMYGKAVVCGQPVEGVIETVSFTYPGIISVSVNQFAYVNFIKNFYKLDLTTGRGIT